MKQIIYFFRKKSELFAHFLSKIFIQIFSFSKKFPIKYFYLFCIIIIILLIIYQIHTPFKNGLDVITEQIKDITLASVSILDSSSFKQSISNTDLSIQNNKILTVLTSRETCIHENLISIDENIRNVRIIYFAVISAILTIFFTLKTGAIIENKVFFMTALFFITSSMYILDLYNEYLRSRQSIDFCVTKKAILKLVNLEPENKTFYTIDLTKLEKYSTNIKDLPFFKSLRIKGFFFLQPSLERLIFYLMPLLVVTISIVIIIIKEQPKI